MFYISPDFKMMAATIRVSTASVEADTPRELFPTGLAAATFPYDVAADGQRFLVLEVPEAQGGAVPLTVVLNWQAGLK